MSGGSPRHVGGTSVRRLGRKEEVVNAVGTTYHVCSFSCLLTTFSLEENLSGRATRNAPLRRGKSPAIIRAMAIGVNSHEQKVAP
jgi:hypothetical protein